MDTIYFLIVGIFFVILFYSFNGFIGTKLTKKKDPSGASAFVGMLFILFLIIIYKLLTNSIDGIRDLVSIGLIFGVPIVLVLISDFYKKKK